MRQSGNFLEAIYSDCCSAERLSSRPNLVVAVHPERGLDISAMEQVNNLLLDQRSAGVAIVLISEDLDTVLTLSDRFSVLYKGALMDILRPEEATIEQIGLMMTGALQKTGLAS